MTENILTCHLIAFIGGFIFDLLFGDPYWLPHPVRMIGNLIDILQNKLLKKENLSAKQKRARGRILVIIVCVISVTISAVILSAFYYASHILGVIAEMVMTYQLLAAKCLKTESMKVYAALKMSTIEDARRAVSMIVGRDTKELSHEQVAKAAVETVAENTSDGEIAPMLYMAIGGPVLGILYKSINTLDSMVGYKNDKYIDFGRCAAKTDDVANYIPSRISGWLIIISCIFLGKDYNVKNAAKIFLRDRRNHASPNSAQTEAAFAGALGIQLAGDASYFGKIVKKPYIGDAIRSIEDDDIKRANVLLYVSSFICVVVCALILGLVGVLV